MPDCKSLGRLLEEWARTVEDFFRAYTELERLLSLGASKQELKNAGNEARELKLMVDRARHRYRARVRSEIARARNGRLIVKVRSTSSQKVPGSRPPN
jgi:hypothetical protein